jgi:fumarate hydratase subunit beta
MADTQGGDEMSNKIHMLKTPISEEQIRVLRAGDVVYLDGTVFTARDLAHERLIKMDAKGEKPEFDLADGAIWHCGPVSRKNEKGEWEVTSIGPTTSYRLTNETPFMLEKHKVRLIIGKGGMGLPTVQAMQKYGAAFLAATGGCATVYAGNVRKVNRVYWEEQLGLAEAVWELSVKELGAMVVAIDSTGATLYEDVMTRAVGKMPACYEKIGVKKPDDAMIHWPPALSGTKDVLPGMYKVGGGS